MRRATVGCLAMALAGPALAQDTPPPTPAWVPRAGADLLALDKVTAKVTRLFVAIGTHVAFGSLDLSVRACEVRPPDQPADATAFLDVTDGTPGAPAFHGWLVRSAPAVSGLQHPIYDVQLAGCR